MEDIVLAYVRPYSGGILALSFALVALKRHAIRKRHLAILVGITVVAFVGFFAGFVLQFAQGNEHSRLVTPMLMGLAALVIGCGSAVGFYLVLVTLGLVRAENEGEVRPPRRSQRSRK